MSDLLERYRDLQAYVGWSDDDGVRIRQIADLVRRNMQLLVDDFYAEIQRHPETLQLITGGQEQISRLKGSLAQWLSESLACPSDADYVRRRWQIGLRHAEIGLNPAYTSAAMARLRNGLIRLISELRLPADEYGGVVESLNKLLDLDLSVINDAYETEHLRRETIAERERSDARFRRLVEAAACLVVILRADGSIAYFSPYSEVITGYTASEVAGQHFPELFVPNEERRSVTAALSATMSGSPINAHETPIVRHDGGRRWLVWNAQRLDDFEGRPAVLLVGQDFTERRHTQELLLRSERLAGIGQMVAGIAHESRNALQRIQSCTEMLELEIEGNDEALQLVRRLQEAQDSLRQLFDEVRGFVAPIRLERTRCRPESIWREAWRLLATSRRGRDATLVEEPGESAFEVEVDRFRLVQVFRNLMENSLAACSDPVVFHVRCRGTEWRGGGAVEVLVSDNGPGLSEEARQNVFEPFFTTKTKGTGLGMPIARRIVEAHGGQIEISASSAGAAFKIILPR